jgi:hypothetical protein
MRTDDRRYNLCMDNVWKNYIRCPTACRRRCRWCRGSRSEERTVTTSSPANWVLRRARALALADSNSEEARTALAAGLVDARRSGDKQGIVALARHAALLCERANELVEALAYYDEALRHEPNDAYLHYGAGNARRMLGQRDRRGPDFSIASSLGVSRPMMILALPRARLLSSTRHLESARRSRYADNTRFFKRLGRFDDCHHGLANPPSRSSFIHAEGLMMAKSRGTPPPQTPLNPQGSRPTRAPPGRARRHRRVRRAPVQRLRTPRAAANGRLAAL